MPTFFMAAFTSEVIGTIAGFGSSTVFLPLSLFFFDFPTALILTAFMHIFGNFFRLVFFKRAIDWGLIITFGLPSVAAALVGASLVHQVSPMLLKTILGLFLVVFATLSLLHHRLKLKRTLTHVVIGGSLAGFFAGLIGVGGAVKAAWLTALSIPKEKYLATTAAIAILVDLTRIPVYLRAAYFPESYTSLIIGLFIIAVIGTYIGKVLVNYLPQRLFSQFVLICLLTVGVYFLLT